MLKVIAISLLFSGGNTAIDNVSNFMPYTDYRCITSTTSVQYKMQQEATTNDQGIRVIDNKCMVALYNAPETKKEPDKEKKPEKPEKPKEPELKIDKNTDEVPAPLVEEDDDILSNVIVAPVVELERDYKYPNSKKVNDKNKYNLGDVLTLNINGQTYDVIVSDVRTTPNTENVIEFIVDTDKLSKEVKQSGSCLSVFTVNNYIFDESDTGR